MTIYYCVYFVAVKAKSVEVMFLHWLVRQCQLPQFCVKGMNV